MIAFNAYLEIGCLGSATIDRESVNDTDKMNIHFHSAIDNSQSIKIEGRSYTERIIINQDIAESLLRRFLLGIDLEPVERR